MGNAKNPVIQYYQIPYSGDIIDFDCLGQEVIFPYDEFEMDLQTLRPLRKYTVYPIVDQKIFTNWCEVVPLLAVAARRSLYRSCPIHKKACIGY